MKKLRIIAVIIVTCLVVIVIGRLMFCVAYKKIFWEPCMETYNELDNCMYEDYYIYVWYTDNIFSTRGDICISQPRYLGIIDGDMDIENQQNCTVDIMVFPKVFGGYEASVGITEPDSDGCAFYLDENMNFISDDVSVVEQEYYEKYKDEIEKEYEVLHTLFGL